jgi:hypothetical protein
VAVVTWLALADLRIISEVVSLVPTPELVDNLEGESNEKVAFREST